jgi:trk system potassium uptake protein TrkH
MRLGAILFILGYGGCMIAGLMVFPWFLSLFDPSYRHAGNFSIALMLTSFASGALLLSSYDIRRHRARGIELLLIMVLFWTVLPLLAALPFIGASQVNSLLSAYFEAVSALTTSGASIFAVPEAAGAPILLWRALLSWLGGLWTLVFAVAVLAPFGIGGITLGGSPLLQHDEDAHLTSRLGRPLRLIFPIYGMFTLIGFFAMLIFEVPAFDALCLTLSAISTSGMVVDSQSMAQFLPVSGQIILASISFIGALSIPLLLLLTLGNRVLTGLRDTELRVFVALIVSYSLVSFLALPDVPLLGGFLQSISLHSTAGFNFLPEGQLSQWPVIWTMVPLIIGGMALSTAGGLKVMRAIILAKDLGSEVGKMAYPSSIHPLKLAGRRLQDSDFTAAWAFTAVLILFVSLGVLLLGLFGVTLAEAWPLVLGALSNSLAVTQHLDMPLGFGAMNGALQITLALLMIAGRIELLILMVLFTSSFWRYMR